MEEVGREEKGEGCLPMDTTTYPDGRSGKRREKEDNVPKKDVLSGGRAATPYQHGAVPTLGLATPTKRVLPRIKIETDHLVRSGTEC
jgi:hypothetical protein